MAKHGRILIIDHEGSVRNSLSRLLTRNGFEVATAANGAKALIRLRKGEHFACVIADVILPDMRGRDFVDTLAKENLLPLERLIMLTSIHNADMATTYLQRGIGAYCGKPYDNDRILYQIRRACGEAPEQLFNPPY